VRLFKRNKTWWIDVAINGQRYRLSLDTTDWREANSRASKKVSEIEQGKVIPTTIDFAKLKFGEACEEYLKGRRLELQPSTHIKEEQMTVRLKEFLGEIRLKNITAEIVQAFRQWRAEAGCQNSTINMEVGLLRRLLKKARRWHVISEDIRPLKEGGTIGRALSPEQKMKLLEVASTKPEWEVAYWAAILALNTTMRAADIRSLRWQDIDLFARLLTVPKSKTKAGERTIPLTNDAYQVLLDIRARAERFGPVEDWHYVFPAHKTSAQFEEKKIVEWKFVGFDPSRPIASWRRAWRALTEKAGLKGLRFHDLRHHAITELAESGVPEQTIMAIAGHVSRRMLDRYSHVRLEAKRAAVEALARHTTYGTNAAQKKVASEGYGTSHGTKREEVAVYSDLNVATSAQTEIGACGFEPQTPTVSR